MVKSRSTVMTLAFLRTMSAARRAGPAAALCAADGAGAPAAKPVVIAVLAARPASRNVRRRIDLTAIDLEAMAYACAIGSSI